MKSRIFLGHDIAAFAREWIAAWNAGDLDRILAHYADDFEMSSPLIRERMGVDSGWLKSKAAVRSYWAISLAAQPPPRFELIDVFAGIGDIIIYYVSVTRSRRVAEYLRFGQDGLVVHAQALYSMERV